MPTNISTTHQDIQNSSPEETCLTHFSVSELNQIIEAVLYSSCTYINGEWNEDDCINFVNLAVRLKNKLESLGKPLEIPKIKLYIEEDTFISDPWLENILAEFGDHIETWSATEDGPQPIN